MNFYDRKFIEFGNSIKSLGWGSSESQKIRFEIINNFIINDCMAKYNSFPPVILDVGCGFGDLNQFFISKYEEIIYFGIDCKKEFIDICKNRFISIKNNFLLGNFVNYDFEKDCKFNWVIASGTFNTYCENWYEIAKKSIEKMFNMAIDGIIINFLFLEKKEDGLISCDPSWIIDNFVNPISKKFVMRKDYKENDFTVCIYKE